MQLVSVFFGQVIQRQHETCWTKPFFEHPEAPMPASLVVPIETTGTPHSYGVIERTEGLTGHHVHDVLHALPWFATKLATNARHIFAAVAKRSASHAARFTT